MDGKEKREYLKIIDFLLNDKHIAKVSQMLERMDLGEKGEYLSVIEALVVAKWSMICRRDGIFKDGLIRYTLIKPEMIQLFGVNLIAENMISKKYMEELWTLIREEDQYRIIFEWATGFDHKCVLERCGGKLSPKFRLYFSIGCQCYMGRFDQAAEILDTANIKWFTRGKMEDSFDPFNSFRFHEFRSLPMINPRIFHEAIDRYFARQAVTPLLLATLPREGASESAASLLTEISHISRYITDLIADNDRASEGPP